MELLSSRATKFPLSDIRMSGVPDMAICWIEKNTQDGSLRKKGITTDCLKRVSGFWIIPPADKGDNISDFTSGELKQ